MQIMMSLSIVFSTTKLWCYCN